MTRLEHIIDCLKKSVAVRDKTEIRKAYLPALDVTRDTIPLGDDCAAIPDPSGGYLLLAAEGLLQQFVEDDPWFAGYSAVMVNISDVCAMGGRPIAVVDVLWTPNHEMTKPVWDGMKTAAQHYGVPIVGGHTTITHNKHPIYLSASILGKADNLLTSFDACPGDDLMMAVDLSGIYRDDNPFWNSTLTTPPDKLREYIELLPQLAESKKCRVAKDISNGGIIGTLIMLLECSGVGAVLNLAELPIPNGVELKKWLISFPSFGYILSVPKKNRDYVMNHFSNDKIICKVVGEITSGTTLELHLDNESNVFWRSDLRGDKNA